MSNFRDFKGLFRRRQRELSEQTTCGHEEELHQQQDKPLDVISTSGIKLQRAVPPVDIRHVSVDEGDIPEQQRWSPHMDQDDADPTHIKEEQEELWVSQPGEHPQAIEEDDATKFPLTIVSVKSEDGEYNGEDFTGTDAGRDFDQGRDLQPETKEKTADIAGPETECCKNLKDMTVNPLGLNSVERDANTVQKTKEHCCSRCDKTFNKKSNLTRHMRIHTGEKPYSCSECTKTFKQRSHLKGHMARHRGEKPFSCDMCGKTFSWLYQLKKHECFVSQALDLYKNHEDEIIQSETDGVDSGLLQPEIEVKIEDFSEPETDDSDDWKETGGHQSDLNSEENTEDMRIESETKSYSCSLCGKKFKTKWNMATHMKNHMGQRQFSCTECGKTFNHKGNMNRHKRIHRQEKPSDSPEHGKRLNRKSSLTAQVSQQSEKKLFGCSECGKMFNYEWHLNRHMIIHTGEKRFICSVCGKRFKQKSYLTLHMALHRGEKPYSCNVCEQRFVWPSQLKNHKCVNGAALELDQNQANATNGADTGADGDDYGDAEQSRNTDPETHLQPETEVTSQDFSELETEEILTRTII